MYFLGCTHLVELDSAAKRQADQHGALQDRSRDMRYVGAPRLFAEFKLGGHVPDHAREAVSRLPGFRAGAGPDEDPFVTRVRYWDSLEAQRENGWTDEQRVEAEQALLGCGDANVLLVEAARVLAPYAKYDEHRRVVGRRTVEHAVADIQQTFEVAGFDVGQAVAYERQNLNDETVVAALEALAAPAPVAAVAQEELVQA